MRPVSFVFGIHNHQPIGNFDNVFEEAYQKSYRPFLDALKAHPTIRWNLHCTGILWEWLEERHPDYLKDVRAMAQSGQVEILSGGFYEPILSIIPDEDKIGQIRKLSRWVEDRFKQTPKGMWCAERVWEPHLPKPIRQAGIEYTVLDDTHFLAAGLDPGQLHGAWRVEEQNFSLDIFPISQRARYTMPFSPPEKTIELLREVSQEHPSGPDPVLVMADDGEKFGMWPETHALVYGEKWLDRFLTLLEHNSSWIRTETFSSYRERNRSVGKVFLPTSSYFEMSEWSLPAGAGREFESAIKALSKQSGGEKIKRFLKGGIWRNFLAKYPEADAMYKKMLRVSARAHGQSDKDAKSKKTVEIALDHLWAGQCNCPYWHGVFGGLYLPILRQAIYKNLISAETLLDSLNGGGVHVDRVDYDNDGNEEVLVETAAQNLYLAPAQGGALVEWDFKPAGINLLNVLTRRPETYHDKLAENLSQKTGTSSGTKSIHDEVRSKETGLDRLLQYDWYRRASLLDHFPKAGVTLEEFKSCSYAEQGDFVLEPYQCLSAKTKAGQAVVELERSGRVWDGDIHRALTVRKKITVKDDPKTPSMTVEYHLSSPETEPFKELCFMPEFNFAMTVPEDQDRATEAVRQWDRVDRHLGWAFRAEFSDPADLWAFNLETVSNSEGGFERTYQGLVFAPRWTVSLKPGQTLTRTLTFTLRKT